MRWHCMTGYAVYLLSRLGQFALVVFIGINIAFIVTHATPIDPVEQSIAAATQFGSTSPEAIALMRQSLKELYGLEGGLAEQYLRSSGAASRVGDFGPSLSAFPTPVSVLIGRALPWTVALLVDLDAAHLGARQPAGRPRRLLPQEPHAAPGRPAGDGLPSHPLLHRGLPAAHRVRLPVAGAADQRRLQDEHGARLELGVHRQPASATPSCRSARWRWSGWAAGSWACARWSPTSSPRTTSPMPSWAA